MSMSRSDTERLDQLERLLQRRNELIWVGLHRDSMWVGNASGRDLRSAVDGFLEEQNPLSGKQEGPIP